MGIITQKTESQHHRCQAPTFQGRRCRRTAGSLGVVCTTHARLIERQRRRYDPELVEQVRRARSRWLDRFHAQHLPRHAVVAWVPVLIEGGAA